MTPKEKKEFSIEVSDDRSRVRFLIGNTELVLGRGPKGKIREVSRCKRDAQVYDPAACYVPPNLYKAIYIQAAAILQPKPSRQAKKKESQRTSLF